MNRKWISLTSQRAIEHKQHCRSVLNKAHDNAIRWDDPLRKPDYYEDEIASDLEHETAFADYEVERAPDAPSVSPIDVKPVKNFVQGAE